MILLPPPPALRVTVAGEGKLRFAVGRQIVTAASATLAANAQGLLADDKGRPLAPAVHVGTDAFKVAMNGFVTVSGKVVSRLVLERPGKLAVEFGYPGEEGFGIVEVFGAEGRGVVGPETKPKNPTPKDPKTQRPAIVVHPTTEIAADRVTLGDIADLDADAANAARLAKIDLGTVPTLDSKKTLGVWTLAAALKGAGFPSGSYRLQFPTDVSVVRKGQTISTETMVGLATAKAQEFAGVEPTLSATPQPLRAPLGETTMNALATRAGDTDLVSVQIEILVDGKPVGTRTVAFRAKLVGVKIGDAVRVTFSLGGAQVETDGKAKTAGGVGSTIQVQTADSATVTATVTGPGKAEVKL